MRTLRVVTFGLLVLVAPAWAQPDVEAVRQMTFRIVVLDANGDVRRAGSGFAVNADGHILTAAHLVAGESRVVATSLTTEAEHLARVLVSDGRADLALLTVNGLTAPAPRFAAGSLDQGSRVYSTGVWPAAGASVPLPAVAAPGVQIKEGAVGRHLAAAANRLSGIPLMEHNALIPAAGYGGAVLNECGEIVGLNRGAPGVPARHLRRGQAPVGVVYAVSAGALADFLSTNDVEFGDSDTPCVGALARAEEEAEQARLGLEAVETRAEETRQQLETAQAEREAAVTRAEEAESRVGEIEGRYDEAVRAGGARAAEAGELRTELDSARTELTAAQADVGNLEELVVELEDRLVREAASGRGRQVVILGAAGALVLAVLGVVVVVWRRRARQFAERMADHAQHAVAEDRARSAEARDAYPDCLLTGRTGEGRAVTLKIPGALLGRDGAVIGRSPRNSTLLIDDHTLSREHARLFTDGESLFMEDLESTNGTRINGADVEPRKPVSLSHGDALEMGAVRLQIEVES